MGDEYKTFRSRQAFGTIITRLIVKTILENSTKSLLGHINAILKVESPDKGRRFDIQHYSGKNGELATC